MGQEEVKDWLCTMQEKAPDKYYTIAEIGRAVGNKDNVYNAVNKLYAYGYLDIKMVKYIPVVRSFKIKEKYFVSWLQDSLNKQNKEHSTDTIMV